MSRSIAQIKQEMEKGMKLIQEMDKIFERWAPIKDYPNYKVSTFGRVKQIKKNKILIGGIASHGYRTVNLCLNGTGKTFCVHRLVAQAFLPINITNKKCVDHIDSNKMNNNISNLRWATHTENGRNKSKLLSNKSGVIGVSWRKDLQKWCAQITINKPINLGHFDNIEDAKKAYENKAKEIFGDFYKAN